jgi:hypothetical protein
MNTLQHRQPTEICAGDRLNHAGVPIIVDWLEETANSWKISYTYEAARFTSGLFVVAKDARHALPIRRYEVSQSDRDELSAYLDEQDAAWLASQGIDPEGELADLREDMLDREFNAHGC